MSDDVVGQRLTVRYRLPDGSATDVIGRVLSLGATIRLERRDGSVAEVHRADVIVWRVVPERSLRPRRARAIDAEELTRITSRGWPAIESRPLGAWELRAADGFTGRANSVAVHGDPGRALAEALAAVEAFYAERGLPPLAQVIVDSAWHRAFLDAGWIPKPGARPGAIVQVADLARSLARADAHAVVTPVADDAWLSLYHRLDGETLHAARAVLEGPPTVGFVRIGDPVSAIGRVVVTGEWAGIAAVEVRPEERRQGLGHRIVTTALAWAAQRGADKAYLQTMQDNTAALALYEPFGFTDHHTYAYLTPP